MNLFSVLQVISALAPLVQGAVAAAESVVGPSRGAEKLKHAAQAVEQALPMVRELAGQLDTARAAVRPMIEATVAAANAAGAFSKKKRAKKKKARR